MRVSRILRFLVFTAFLGTGLAVASLLHGVFPLSSALGQYSIVATLVASGVLGYWVPQWLIAEDRNESAWTMFQQGQEQLRSEPKTAALSFAVAAQLHDHPQNHLWHAIAIEETGDLSEARVLYSAAYWRTPMNDNFRPILASCLSHVAIRLDDFEAAEEWATKSIERFKETDLAGLAYVRLDRGLARWRLGREEEAHEDFEWVLSNPTDVEQQRYARTFASMASWTDKAKEGVESFLTTTAAVERLYHRN